ncbi:MAG: hypothetical protein HZB15_04525 [Actinobacteria bacterium]|nr:hypothetical protein [Actinomycetota bacterium]
MQARLRTALLCTATFVAAPVAWSPAAPAAGAVDEIVTNTGIAGSPVEVEAAPSGFGVITGTGAAGEPTVTLRGPNGAATDLGEANAPAFFLGTAADPLLVSTRDERTGQDLNGDGDEVDTVLVTSDGTSPFASVAGGPVTVDTASPFVDCLRRISATLAVACFSEGASDTDLNSDTDFGDLELVLVDDTGTIDLTGQFIADINTVGDIDGLTLPDGSVAIGPARVMPNGAITIVTSVTDAQITALLGTNLVVTSRSSGATYVVPSVGAPMAVGTGGWLAFQVGSAVWVNNPISPGLCRLNADASTSCLGIAATWSVTQINNPDPTLIPLGRRGRAQ